MDPKEKCFFKICYELTRDRKWTIKDVILIFDGVIDREQLYEYLKKWTKLGFYSYGTTLDSGSILIYKIPPEYR